MFWRTIIASLLFVAVFSVYGAYGADECQFDYDCNEGRCVEIKSSEYPNGTMICKCDKGYVNFNDDFCNYKQKKQLVAFLLSFFLGEFGAEWFYVGDGNAKYDGIGAFKCLLFVLAMVFICISGCCSINNNNGASAVMVTLCVLTWLAMVVWYFTDFVRIATDPCNMKDPNNICLESW